MGLKRIQIRLIPTLSLWILNLFLSSFFADLTTEAVKSKKCKSFLNSNDFEDNERNPCFNNYSEKKERKTFSQHKNRLTAMII